MSGEVGPGEVEPGRGEPGEVAPGEAASGGGAGHPDDRPVHEQVELTPPHEVASAALARARAAARAKGLRPGSPGRRRPPGDAGVAEGSGPGPSRRDPALLGDTAADLADQWGWTREISVGGVIGRWAEVVGPQVAERCRPETFDDGVLVVRADSTAWAVQVRRLVPQLLARLAEEIGEGVVREVQVLGPAGPGWGRGALRVPGRGPRDTYG